MTQPLPLDTRIEVATSMAMKTTHFFSLFLLTKSEQGHRLHRAVISEFFEVIRFQQAACRDAALIELHSLFADRRDSVNLPRLMREVEADDGPLVRAREIYAAVSRHLPKIKLLRDRALAHRTKHAKFDDVFRQADITYAEVSETIDAAVLIVAELRHARDLPPEEVSPLPLETYNRMLADLAINDK